MKALAYIRVSTSDQANSLEVQTKKIQDYCKFREIELTDIFVDEDVSGGKPFYDRKGGQAAHQALLSGTKSIICVRPDRMFRSVKDALITVDDWSKKNISLHVIDLGGNSIDTQTAMGRIFFIQSISMAEFERLITSERTKAVLNHKKETKKAYCGEILGYDKVDGNLIPNPSEQKIVKLIKQLRADGESTISIADYLNLNKYRAKRGGKFYPSTVNHVLNNEIYN